MPRIAARISAGSPEIFRALLTCRAARSGRPPVSTLRSCLHVAQLFLLVVVALAIGNPCRANGETAFERKVDVVYGRKDGMALTMDVFTPKGQFERRGDCLDRQRWLVLVARCDRRRADRRIPEARVHRFRGRARQPAQVHDSRDRQGHQSGGAVHPVSCQRLSHRPGPDRNYRRLGRRAPFAHAGNRRRPGRQECQGPCRPDVEPSSGGRLLLPTDRLSQLRQAGRERRRTRGPGRVQAAVRLPGIRSENQDLRPITDEAKILEIAARSAR